MTGSGLEILSLPQRILFNTPLRGARRSQRRAGYKTVSSVFFVISVAVLETYRF